MDETPLTSRTELPSQKSRIPSTYKAQMQSQVLQFPLKENKFNSQARGIKVIFFLPPPPRVCPMTFFFLAVSESSTTFWRTKQARGRRWGCGACVWCKDNTSEGVGWGLFGGGGVYLRFPVWMLSCFLVWTDAVVHRDEGGGGHDTQRRGDIKPPRSQEAAHYIPLHCACSCKILILAFRRNPVE